MAGRRGPDPSTRHKARLTFRVLVVGLIVLLTLSLALAPLLGGAIGRATEVRADQHAATVLIGEVTYLDEVLTMSARMAAATLDPAWMERYHAAGSKLNATLAALAALDPDHGRDFGRLVAQTSTANDRLVAMEEEAFRLVRSGQGAQGLALLTGPEYERWKAEYSAGNAAASEHLTQELAAKSAEVQRQLRWITAAFTGVLLGAVGIAVTLAVQVQRSGRREAQAKVEALEELNAFRVSFINMAAHELATPLTPIRLQAAVMRVAVTRMDNQPLVASAALLERNVTRLAGLLDDVLLVARFSADAVPVAHDPVDLSALLKSLVGSIRPAAAAKGLVLALRAPRPAVVLGDSERLGHVLLTLLSNGVKYTPAPGTVTLSLRVEGPQAVVEVSDTGRGLSPGQVPALFQPFGRLGDSAATSGAGLGLYLSRLFVEAHDGTIGAASPGLGQGSTFTVRLPLAG